MIPLNDQQKQLIFDYCFGLTSELENAQIQELIFSNEQAARIAQAIKAALSPLDLLTPKQCPEELAEGTIWRAKQTMRTSQLRLTELITAEQSRKPSAGERLWRGLFGRLATAAIFVIVGSALITGGRLASNYAHQRYWQTKCAANLGGLFTSLSNYQNDNDGQLPSIAAPPGSPWYRIGDQGSENVSNTRRMWLLAKHGYAQPEDFICPANRIQKVFPANPEQLNDFPDRTFVSYSFRIRCPKSAPTDFGKRVVISDLNPLFEKIIPTPTGFMIILNNDMLTKNSPNHAGRGQNVLFCDGSVQFVRSRHVDVSMDDIFTLQDISCYEGVELPATETDAFLAP
ncbi:MAG: hypothetical protein JW749_10655 [Sedimentisphaerales bacterium]|nr:hypothetical protein [Sedimentisphaerales bacterium]